MTRHLDVPPPADHARGSPPARPRTSQNARALVFTPALAAFPIAVREWLAGRGLGVDRVARGEDIVALCARTRPRVAVLDGRDGLAATLALAGAMKADAYTAVVPLVLLAPSGSTGATIAAAFGAGADEVLVDGGSSAVEWEARLDAVLARSDRDSGVHPSTRLPGAPTIEAEYGRRIATGATFAVCYVDLDHFKEFNDRYSYLAGDRVIRLLADILHDVVSGLCGRDGFVGHIGGDDFICIVPLEAMTRVCSEIVDVFDALLPLQYSAADRATGYYFGKDRRGRLHRVPLMTVSIGVVTNGRRALTDAVQISELATEMKSYAKTFPGSIYVVDRRRDGVADPAAGSPVSAGHGAGADQ